MTHSPQNIRYLADTIQARFPVEAQVLREVAMDLEVRRPLTVSSLLANDQELGPENLPDRCPYCFGSHGAHSSDCNSPQNPIPATSTDPKATAATGKTRLDLVPPAASKACADALAFGAITKGYGTWNWRKSEGVKLSTYVAAIKRHLDDLMDGEDCAPDSGIHHVGHVMGGAAIILDAMKHGKLIDDRVKAKEVA